MIKMVRFPLPVLVLVVLSLAVATPATRAGSPSPAWNTEVVDASDCWYLSMALTTAGLPRVAYAALGDLRYAWHDGLAWHIDTVEDSPSATGWYPSLVLDDLGSPHISYYSPGSDSLMYAYWDGAAWQIEELGTPYDLGGQTSLDLDAAGRPHIVYWDRTHLTVGYAWHNGAAWQYDTVATLAESGQDVSLEMALDSNGRPHLCYYLDEETSSLQYVYRDASTWQRQVIVPDLSSYNGQHCSIALDAGDRPHIAYRDLGLWYARRSGTAWSTTLVDDDFFAADNPSLDLDASGRPHISYNDWAVPDQELRYARLGAAGWWIETVDVAAETHRFADTSLALDDAGRPHIAYWDLGGISSLKYAGRDTALAINAVYLPIIQRP